MTEPVKAIETSYKGYRFRSRLEARWAVFLDTAGVEWQYEPQGYDLGAAGPYLPDFWLPSCKRWLEVKPVSPGFGSPEAIKIEAFGEVAQLSWNVTGDEPLSCWRFSLLVGQPWPGEYEIGPELEDWGWCAGCNMVDLYPFHRHHGCHGFYCNRCDSGDPRSNLQRGEMAGWSWYQGDWSWKGGLDPWGHLTYAFETARSARFEHGESPGQPPSQWSADKIQAAAKAIEARQEERRRPLA